MSLKISKNCRNQEWSGEQAKRLDEGQQSPERGKTYRTYDMDFRINKIEEKNKKRKGKSVE